MHVQLHGHPRHTSHTTDEAVGAAGQRPPLTCPSEDTLQQPARCGLQQHERSQLVQTGPAPKARPRMSGQASLLGRCTGQTRLGSCLPAWHSLGILQLATAGAHSVRVAHAYPRLAAEAALIRLLRPCAA